MNRLLSSTPGRVLVVDDDLNDGRILAAAIARELGCQVSATSDFREAMPKGDRPAFDVVVTDFLMPNRDGLALLAEIKAHVPTCEVVVVTIAPQIKAAVACMRIGAADYCRRGPDDESMAGILAVIAKILHLRPSLRAPGYHREYLIDFFSERIGTDPTQKRATFGQLPPGLALEYVVKLLLDSCEGFETRWMRFKTPDEELDLVCLNNSEHPFWVRQREIVLVECKDWGKAKPGANERGRLEQKIRNRDGRSSVGLFVSTAGFAKTFLFRRGQTAVPGGQPPLILAIDGSELRGWIEARDRSEWLVRHATQTIMG